MPPTIENLRARAEAIRLIVSSSVSSAILERVRTYRGEILSSTDADVINAYIDSATDAECLCVLLEMSLKAPLNDTFYRIFAHLASTELPAAGLPVPDGITEDGPLSRSQERELQQFRRELRASQARAKAKVVLQ